MKDYDLFVRFKDITQAKTAVEMAKMLNIKHAYISQIKGGSATLSEKIANRMWVIAGNDIAEMWGRLQIEKMKAHKEVN